MMRKVDNQIDQEERQADNQIDQEEKQADNQIDQERQADKRIKIDGQRKTNQDNHLSTSLAEWTL